jgi:hypothetical protein
MKRRTNKKIAHARTTARVIGSIPSVTLRNIIAHTMGQVRIAGLSQSEITKICAPIPDRFRMSPRRLFSILWSHNSKVRIAAGLTRRKVSPVGCFKDWSDNGGHCKKIWLSLPVDGECRLIVWARRHRSSDDHMKVWAKM